MRAGARVEGDDGGGGAVAARNRTKKGSTQAHTHTHTHHAGRNTARHPVNRSHTTLWRRPVCSRPYTRAQICDEGCDDAITRVNASEANVEAGGGLQRVEGPAELAHFVADAEGVEGGGIKANLWVRNRVG